MSNIDEDWHVIFHSKTTCELDELEQLEEDVAEVVSGVVTKMGLQLHPKKLVEVSHIHLISHLPEKHQAYT